MLAFATWAAAAQEPILNEVVSRNDASLRDAGGTSPDWIEVHNPGTGPIALEGYRLTDGGDAAGAWAFPAVELPPGGYVIVFASGRAGVSRDELQADFRLSGSGETVRLYAPGGDIVDEVAVPALLVDEAYARRAPGGQGWYRTATPTPGAPNAGSELSFSHPPGSYPEPFTLRVESSEPAVVRYTRDGSVPSSASPMYDGGVYVTPAAEAVFAHVPTTADGDDLSYPEWRSPPVDPHRAAVLRFAAFDRGARVSRVYTRTYFVDGPLEQRYTVPVVSLVTDGGNLFSPDTGIYVTGAQFDPGNPEWTGNAFEKGRDWERPAHVTYFESDGEVAFAQDAGVRVHGGKTRQAAQKTLRLYARGEYGTRIFAHRFFPDRDEDHYERLLLRTTVGAWFGPTIVKDALVHAVARDLDLEAQDSRPVVVYVNGEYWGVHTLMDRVDERHLAKRAGLPEDSVDLWSWSQPDVGELKRYAEANDLSVEAYYRHVAQRVDVDNLITYVAVQQFFANRDWPGNNATWWRPLGGRWRWVLYDLDAAFGSADRDMFERTLREPREPQGDNHFTDALVRALLDNEDFRARYLERFAELLAGPLSPSNTLPKLRALQDQYRPELPAHVDRWGFPGSVREWSAAVEDELVSFLYARPCLVAAQLREFFDLATAPYVCEDASEVSSLALAPNPSAGAFDVRNAGEVDLFLDRLRLVDALGRVVHERTDLVLHPGERYDFAAVRLSPGTYTAIAESGSAREAMRLIILQP